MFIIPGSAGIWKITKDTWLLSLREMQIILLLKHSIGTFVDLQGRQKSLADVFEY